MARWLVAGAGGMLGPDIMLGLLARGHAVLGLRRGELDIRQPGGTRGSPRIPARSRRELCRLDRRRLGRDT
jgi:nucleoside-diphosphate-sugar epimerase